MRARAPLRPGQAEVPVGLERGDAAARRAADEALLQQVRLDDLLQGIARLGQRRGNGLDADRAAVVALGDAGEVAAIERVEALGVDFERGRAPCRRAWRR